MPDTRRFDVFLSHNSKDKVAIRELAGILRDRGLNVWLDEWELRPGHSWQDALEDIISRCESAAVCVAENGIGPWEEPEMQALLRRFASEKRSGIKLPIIPVLLPGAPDRVELPMFLEAFTWVDLRCGIVKEGVDRILWGITGEKPNKAQVINDQDGKVEPQDELLLALRQMPPAFLVDKVVERLIRLFNYDEVETINVSRSSALLRCWRRDETDDKELGVVLLNTDAPDSIDNHFSNILNQLTEYIETPIPNTDGQRYLPSTVYFVTPFDIASKTLNERLPRIAALRQFRVKLIDGQKLARLIRSKLPGVATELLGTSEQLRQITSAQVSNEVLMNALGFQATRHIKEFYTDIDIAVGHVHARYFLSSEFHPKSLRVNLKESDWEDIKPVLKSIRDLFRVNLWIETTEEIDHQFEKKKRAWDEWKENSRRLNGLVQRLAHESSELAEAIETTVERSVFLDHAISEDVLDSVQRVLESIKAGESLTVGLKANTTFDAKVQGMLDNYREHRVQYSKAEKDAAIHRENEPPITASIATSGNGLVEQMKIAKDRISEQSAKLQEKVVPTASDLRIFIENCQEMFNATATILQNPIVAEIVGLSPANVCVSQYTRLSFPIDLVFATGLNVAVLGEAGAGKSTALQMYAFRHYESKKREKLVVYAPLNQVAHFANVTSAVHSERPVVRSLDIGIVGFLRSLGATYSLEEFHADARRGGIVLLDSIDEAITKAPWIIDSLVAFAEKYPKLQLITSSRVSGVYAERIPFVGIRLMPFTDEQQVCFVSNWFGDDPESHVSTICNHLSTHREVADAVRNPLLATAMCALQEHKVPLPTSEIRLYEEWLSLLVGVYDIHKNVSRITTPKHYLETLAEKIAFYLQLRGQRQAKKAIFFDLAGDLFDHVMNKSEAETALNELIDPCNILLPVTWSDQIGFGHLRYQEYLAARELRNNRGIAIKPLISSTWWRGVLVLFSQMHDSLDWLVEELADEPIDEITRDNVLAMIEAGPSRGREALRNFVIKKAELDAVIETKLRARKRSKNAKY